MKKKQYVLIWFRNNLRIHDNITLYKAYKKSLKKKIGILGIFITTHIQWQIHNVSKKKIKMIYKNLFYLKKELLLLKIPFFIKHSTDFYNSVKYIIRFCKKKFINSIFYDYQFEFNERNRDLLLIKKIKKTGIKIYGFHDNTLLNPNLIKQISGSTYKKFSFFKKKIIKIIQNKSIKILKILKNKKNFYFLKKITIKINKKNKNKKKFVIKNLSLLNKNIKKLIIFFKKIKKNFLKKNINKKKNIYSKISILLSLGLISVRQCFYYGIIIMNKILFLQKNLWLDKLLWREFYYYLFFHNKNMSKGLFINKNIKKINWNKNNFLLESWKKGKTGYPIIDAIMKSLNKTGWINNRHRMISANFLVKILYIDWKEGEKYFLSKLIDSDFIINNGNWNWTTSLELDFCPYIRFFNPYTQSKKIDPNGIFIRKYIPEISIVPNKFIHKPHIWSKKNKIFIKYPNEIVNYKKNLKNNKKKFQNIKKMKYYDK